jgi:ribosomal protein S18 acetylase RimI-like enzyme
VTIRRAATLASADGVADRAWMLALGGAAFADLGPYQEILAAWLQRAGVYAWIAEADGARVGFAMLGFYEERAGDVEVAVADLLALAVTPTHRRRGVASGLLRHVIDAAAHGRAHGAHGASVLRLTVATDNHHAHALYLRHGFVDEEVAATSYPSGLVGRRMGRPL